MSLKQHILVTGGAGFIGSHLVDALVLRGYDVTVLDKDAYAKIDTINSKAHVLNLDLTEPGTMEKIKFLKPDIMYHFAANASVAKSVKDPLFDFKINYNATAELLDVASKIGVKLFVFASTGGGLSSEYTVLPTPEHLICKPLSPYAIHKLASEQLGEFYRVEKGVPFVALRFANVYGPRQSVTNGEANIVATFADRMVKNEQTNINGTGRQTRDYVYVNDVIDACLRVLDRPHVLGPINIGSGMELNVLQIHQTMASYLGYEKVSEFRAASPGEPMRSCLDVSKAHALLGWSPRVTFADGIARTLEWHLARKKAMVAVAK